MKKQKSLVSSGTFTYIQSGIQDKTSVSHDTASHDQQEGRPSSTKGGDLSVDQLQELENQVLGVNDDKKSLAATR